MGKGLKEISVSEKQIKSVEAQMIRVRLAQSGKEMRGNRQPHGY